MIHESRDTDIENIPNEPEAVSLITTALSGTTGGAIIGATFGIPGAIIGGIIGTTVTGLAGYYNYRAEERRYKITRVNNDAEQIIIPEEVVQFETKERKRRAAHVVIGKMARSNSLRGSGTANTRVSKLKRR